MNAAERIQQLKNERDRARDAAVALEQENAVLRSIVTGERHIVALARMLSVEADG